MIDYLYKFPYKQISKEEEKEIIERIKNGDKEAEDFLFFNHVKLISVYASNYKTNIISMKDLIHETYFSFKKALSMYNENDKARFNTYFMQWVKKFLQKYYFLNKSIVSDKTPINKNKIQSVGGDSINYILSETKEPFYEENIKFELYDGLTETERYVLHEKINNNRTLRDISNDFGTSYQMIGYYYNNAINKIKKYSDEEYITVTYPNGDII